MWTVYMHRSPSGKVYIGLTGRKPQHRWGADGKYYKTQPFYYAIRKYGWDNIEHIILSTTESLEEARELEKRYIAEYDATNPEHGYNFCTGGEINDARRGQSPSAETRKKQSEKMRGERNPNYGKPLSEQHKQRLREYRTGRKLSEETKRKIGENERGANNANAKAVLQFERNGTFLREWDCVSDAAEALCGKRKGSCNIASCCAGKIASAYGYNWKYKEVRI